MQRPGMFCQKEEIQLPLQTIELSLAIQFLNSIEPAQALQFYEEMTRRMKCVERINPQHIKPTLTNTDELKNMTGCKGQDGKFYWLSLFSSYLFLF
jgi:hypothetical protein